MDRFDSGEGLLLVTAKLVSEAGKALTAGDGTK